MATLIALVLLLVTVSGCGGKLAAGFEEPPTSSDDPSIPEKMHEDPVLPEEGEWGTWQLLSVEQPDGRRNYRPPFVELDLHPGGEAYLWHCYSEPTGSGGRCPFYARFGCLVGRISVVGTTWRVEFPAARGLPPGSGIIADEPSGDIFVNGEGSIPAGGHYRRVAAASVDRCVP